MGRPVGTFIHAQWSPLNRTPLGLEVRTFLLEGYPHFRGKVYTNNYMVFVLVSCSLRCFCLRRSGFHSNHNILLWCLCSLSLFPSLLSAPFLPPLPRQCRAARRLHKMNLHRHTHFKPNLTEQVCLPLSVKPPLPLREDTPRNCSGPRKRREELL